MNFRNILSKSSLKSSSASDKSTAHSVEVSQLHAELGSLRRTVDSLKVSLENRDAAIGTLAREKEKLYVQLKSAQRTNRNLHQQLVDERDIHSKEKEYLIEEIKRVHKNEDSNFLGKLDTCLVDNESHHLWKEEIKAKDEVIYNICAKYFKIKSSKKRVQQELEKIQSRSQKTCENLILLMQENRNTLDILLNKLMKSSSIAPDNKNYIKLLKVNSNLHYENIQLKVCLSHIDFLDYEDTISKNKECYENGSIYRRKYSKSESKLKFTNIQVRHHSLHSRLSRVKDCDTFRNFKNVYGAVSPYFRRKICRSNSDPCIFRF